MDIAYSDDNRILDLLPDGVLAVDCDLVVRRINPAACRLLGLRDAAELIGCPVNRIMEEAPFLRLRDGALTQFSDTVALNSGEAVPGCSFQCDAERSLLVCVLRPMTAPQPGEDHAALSGGVQRAAELADSICEKQLNIVSQIASLLGETAVETQAVVHELKKTLLPGKEGKNG